jgi:hypothetical protein
MMSDPGKSFRRAEFWDGEQCTLLDIANVLGRWESAGEWAERMQFSLYKSRRVENAAQGATLERYEYAQRNNLVERVAMQQNVPKLPFRDTQLAASFGKSTEDFEAIPVSLAAVDVVFDAMVQSKGGLLGAELCDQRRAKFVTAEGSIDEGAIAAGLYRSRALVCFSWIFFGKGRLYGFAVAVKFAFDAIGRENLFPEALAPYVDYLLLLAALGLAIRGFQSQADVMSRTGDYETVSLADAEADRALGIQDDTEYSTVFQKWAAPRPSAESAATKDGSAAEEAANPIVPVAAMVCTLLFLSAKREAGF